jgi:hypothetical protein
MVAPSQPIIGKTSKEPFSMGSLRGKRQTPPGKQGGMANQKWMNSAQIITKFFTKTLGSEEKANQMLNLIGSKIKKKQVQLVQLGNTVFVIYPRPDKSAEFHSVTVEPQNLAQRIKTLANTLKEMGFIKMYTLSVTPESEKLAKETGLPVKRVQSQMMSGKGMVPAFRYEVTL